MKFVFLIFLAGSTFSIVTSIAYILYDEQTWQYAYPYIENSALSAQPFIHMITKQLLHHTEETLEGLECGDMLAHFPTLSGPQTTQNLGSEVLSEVLCLHPFRKKNSFEFQKSIKHIKDRIELILFNNHKLRKQVWFRLMWALKSLSLVMMKRDVARVCPEGRL